MTPKLSTLKEGEKVTFKSGLIAYFSHFNEKDSPGVFSKA